MSWIFGSYLAFLFPNTNGIDLLFEIELFWIEHALLCITPFILIFSKRYESYQHSKIIMMTNHFFGFALACLY